MAHRPHRERQRRLQGSRNGGGQRRADRADADDALGLRPRQECRLPKGLRVHGVMCEPFRTADVETRRQTIEDFELAQRFEDPRRPLALPPEAAVPRSPHASGQSHGQSHGGLFRLAIVVDAKALQRRIGKSLDHLTGHQQRRHPSRMSIDAAR